MNINCIYTRIVLTIAVILFFVSPSPAEVYSYSQEKSVMGFTRAHIVQKNESLIEIARKFDLGFNEITEANPSLDPFVPGTGANIIIPTSWILPDAESYDGIIINLSEMRLYYFFTQKGSKLVRTFPIGIGSQGNNTPEGTFTIVEKTVNPSWHVPESIRKVHPELQKIEPPGPENPLGTHALRLSLGSILIHGTHRPYGVGRKVSHGCIRLYPEDIPKLFQLVPLKTKVTIVRQPLKVGTMNNQVYIEVHKDTNLEINYFDEAVKLLRKKNLYDAIDKDKMIAALKEKKGFPVNISGQ